MINFKKIELTDIPILKAYFSAYPSRQCDRSAGATAMWRDYFENCFAVIDGTIIFSSNFKDEVCFSFPIGKNVSNALDKLEEHCNELGIPLVFCTVNKAELPVLEKHFGKITADADRDWFDYLYEKDAMLNLSGRKYGTPRNHINKFKKLYTDWSFEPISGDNSPELIEFTKNFTFGADKDESAMLELQMCMEVLEKYDSYAMLGGALRVGGKIIAYSIGEIVGDTIFSHIEKADISYAGAYQMLTNQFLRMYAEGDDIKYVNREEDCGDEGLRKSKLSYHPVELIEKNTVYIERND